MTYGIAMIFCGIPIFFQEVAVGQYLGAGGMTLVGQLCPILQGESQYLRIQFLKFAARHSMQNVKHLAIQVDCISRPCVLPSHIFLLVKPVLAKKPNTNSKAAPYVIFTTKNIDLLLG